MTFTLGIQEYNNNSKSTMTHLFTLQVAHDASFQLILFSSSLFTLQIFCRMKCFSAHPLVEVQTWAVRVSKVSGLGV